MRRQYLIGIMSVLLLSGCANVSPVQVGQTAGAIAGSAIAPGVGTSIGALVGLMAGMVVQGQVDQVTERRERKELSNQLGAGAPQSAAAPSTAGTPTRVWVDETIQNGRRMAGRFDVRSLP